MSRRQPASQVERLAVVEERVEGLTGDVAEVNQKLDRLLDLANERAIAIGHVQQSMGTVQKSLGSLRDETKIIRDGMLLARVLRRLVMWGAPLGAALWWAIGWVIEHSEILTKLIRRP